jgi:hypothetical protein
MFFGHLGTVFLDIGNLFIQIQALKDAIGALF